MTSISPYRSLVACAIAAQSSTALPAQARRDLNSSCHDCCDLVSLIRFGGSGKLYGFGMPISTLTEDGLPGDAGWDIRMS